MGNIGRSSTGCGLCRKRKIKCDEGKPGCRKCAQIRKPCPGYPFMVELQIRAPSTLPEQSSPPVPVSHRSSPFVGVVVKAEPASLNAAGRDLTRNTSSLRPPDTATDGKSESKPQSQVQSHTGFGIFKHGKSPNPPPKYDVQHQATCFFLNLFSIQATQVYGVPVLDFLPNMLRIARPNSCVLQAVNAVSRMTLADRYSGRDPRLQTSHEYGKALKMTSTTIKTASEAVKDETLMAVWLLSLYEAVNSVLSHGRDAHRNPQEEWKSHIFHIRGALDLLKLRGLAQFDDPRSERIFRVFKAAIQMRLFVLNSVTSKDFDDLDIGLYEDEQEFVPSETANKATSYFYKVARLHERIKHALAKEEAQPGSRDVAATFDHLLDQGQFLDSEMKDWSKSEAGWDIMKVNANTTGTMWALYPSHALYYFYSFWVFLYWLRYLIARVKLFESLIEVVRRQSKPLPRLDADLKIQRYKTIIQFSAAQLIGITAYSLGDVTNTGYFCSSASGLNSSKGWREVNVVAAMQLVIPLKVLQQSEHPTPTQKGAIDLAVSQIGDGFRRQPIVS